MMKRYLLILIGIFAFASACNGQPKDSTVVIDSLRLIDSLNVIMDTTFVDSINIIDSLNIIDSVRIVDSLRITRILYLTQIRDSIVIRDTTIFTIVVLERDSLVVRDSIAIRDSIVITDSVETRDSTEYIGSHIKNPTVPDSLSIGVQQDINAMIAQLREWPRIEEEDWIDDIIVKPILSDQWFMITLIDVNLNRYDFFVDYEPNDYIRT